MKSTAFPGVKVTLRVNGVELEEYEDVERDDTNRNNDNSVISYVEAMPDANFAVNLSYDSRFIYWANDIRMRIRLDGRRATAKVYSVHPGFHTVNRSCVGIESAGKDGSWQLQKFTFAKLSTTDEYAKPSWKEKLSNVGEIVVELTRVKKQGPSANQHKSSSFEPKIASEVPEKALKGRAISNYTTLSNPEKCKYSGRVHCEYPWGHTPFIAFKFKYRSHKDLQIEGIIPRSPSPVPLEQRDPESLSAEERLERIRRLEQQLADSIDIKREKRDHSSFVEDDDDADDSDDDVEVTEVTTERKRRKVARDSGVEVIDLSGD